MARPVGQCSICGQVAELTFEHVPPKAAFNDHGVLYADTHELFSADADPRTVRRHESRRGAGRHTLCEKCNNDTGNWYAPAYVEWARQGMGFRYAAPTGSSLALPFQILPGRVAKQILCMFASANGPGFFDGAHDLRRYVLNREHRGIPKKFRLYAYIHSHRSTSTRQSGIMASMVLGNEPIVFAEIAFPPFGFILTIDSRPGDGGLADLTHFTNFGFHDFSSEYIRIPVREVNSYFPADFRNREEWEATLERTARERVEKELTKLAYRAAKSPLILPGEFLPFPERPTC